MEKPGTRLDLDDKCKRAEWISHKTNGSQKRKCQWPLYLIDFDAEEPVKMMLSREDARKLATFIMTNLREEQHADTP